MKAIVLGARLAKMYRAHSKTSVILFLQICLFSPTAQAAPNYHLVGWVNTIVPGGGEYLLGNYGAGALETSLEVSSFYIGYNNSKRTPMTLDGVPEDLPAPSKHLRFRRVSRTICVVDKKTKKNVCSATASTDSDSSQSADVDISNSLYADWLQEFGLKYHMINVFESYRKAAGPDVSFGTQKIDQTSTSDLFLAPFQLKNLSSVWVFPALAITGAALIYSFQIALHDGSLSPISPLNQNSQRIYDATYMGVFPTGSAAPEEMFYRGFVQYELYNMIPSALFSVGFSSGLYAFSHSSDDRISAALTGAYLGIVSHADGGQLSKGIAYHFWADFMAGLYQIAVVRKESRKVPLFHLELKF